MDASAVSVALPQPPPADAVSTQHPKRGLRQTLLGHWRRLLFAYTLFTTENLLRLAQPLTLGWAITDLLGDRTAGLVLFMVNALLQLVLGVTRRMYDTRTFTRIYTEVAGALVIEQRQRAASVSQVTARSAFAREIVEFFERDLAVSLHTLYSVLGALLMLVCFDGWYLLVCAAAVVPAFLVAIGHGRRSGLWNRRLNDQLEREVEVIEAGAPNLVGEHYERLARSRVRISDCQALAFGAMELLLIAMTLVALWRSGRGTVQVGEIYSVLRYTLMFGTGLNNLPGLVQQLARLRDIVRRVRAVG